MYLFVNRGRGRGRSIELRVPRREFLSPSFFFFFFGSVKLGMVFTVSVRF